MKKWASHMRITPETILPSNRKPVQVNSNLLELPAPPSLGFGANKVFIEKSLYDGFVAWGREAMIDYGVALDETTRLARLLTDASGALCFGGGCFVTRAVHAKQLTHERRHVLTLNRKAIDTCGRKLEAWVIEP